MSGRADFLDGFLVSVFLLGIYLDFAVHFGAIPVPAVIAGGAGMVLLIKHAPRVQTSHLVAGLVILLLYLLSILAAPGLDQLGQRFRGLVQLSYAIVLGYAFYLTALRFSRDGLAVIFLTFCVAMVIGAALENYTGFAAVSDAVRAKMFDVHFVYQADLRDMQLYGQIRPKVFTAEPSLVSFALTLYAFAFYALSTWRGKLVIFLGLLAAGYLLMRGPTLLLGLVAILPYEVLLRARQPNHAGGAIDIGRASVTLLFAGVFVGIAIMFGLSLFSERVHEIVSGTDPSFFARVVAPILVTWEILTQYPIAGVGLSGWALIEQPVGEIYANAPQLVTETTFRSAQYGVTNYFWEHWLFLGAVFGTVVLVAVSVLLRWLGAPSLLFCWIIWAMFGHAMGAYVSPRAWLVLFLACTVSVLHQRAPFVAPPRAVPAGPAWRPLGSPP